VKKDGTPNMVIRDGEKRKELPEFFPKAHVMEQVKGISRRQGACPLRGACGVLDYGFSGGISSSTQIRTLFAFR